MFDAHCHLDRCTEDPAVVLKRAQSAGVTDLLIAGVEAHSWPAQTALWGPGVHIAWGVHPWRVASAPESITHELGALDALLRDPPVPPVALGETGLDHGRRIDTESHANQEHAFRAQIRLAHQYALPLILHVVRAHAATIEILKEEGLPQAGGLVHSFSGNSEQAQRYIQMGLHLSFCGSVVNPRNTRVRHAVKHVPAERLLVETDAPDQTPISRIPHPNEPAFLIDVIAAIAELRDSTSTEVADITAANAHALFRTQPS
jgi:TatD DNase family protein